MKKNDEKVQAERMKIYNELRELMRKADITEREGPSTIPLQRDVERKIGKYARMYERRVPKEVRDTLDISDQELRRLKREYS